MRNLSSSPTNITKILLISNKVMARIMILFYILTMRAIGIILPSRILPHDHPHHDPTR
jgi:hypothetical protein